MRTDDKTEGGAGSLIWLYIFILYLAIYLLVVVEDIFNLGFFKAF